MGNIFIRITIFTLAIAGVYKIFPQISGPVDYYLKNPKFISGIVKPVVNTANRVLPDKIQIPTPPEIMGVATDSSTSSPIKELTDEIGRQAASIAGEQINQLRKSATDTFCNALIEKLKAECGQVQTP